MDTENKKLKKDIVKKDSRYKLVISAISICIVVQIGLLSFFLAPMAYETIKSVNGAPPKIERLIQWAKLNGNDDGAITLTKTENEDIWRARIGEETFIVLNDGSSVVLENGEIINFNLLSSDIEPVSVDRIHNKEIKSLKSKLKERSALASNERTPKKSAIDLQNSIQDRLSSRLGGSPKSEEAMNTEDSPVIRKLGFDEDGNQISPEELSKQVKRVFGNIVAKEDWLVHYKAKGEEKDQILVFSDPTCGFCRKLHKSIPFLNENGITVSYLFYPRALNKGADDPAAVSVINVMKNAWCSTNPAESLDKVYAGQSIPEANCSDNNRPAFPGYEHFVLGNVLNLTGTPLTVNKDGRTIGGFSNIASYLNNIR